MSAYVVVSFSGGKDSTAMLLHMIELGEHIDEVVNIDTGKEFPQMYEHIEKVRILTESAGVKFTVLRAEHSFEYYMFDKETHSEKYGDHKGFGWPTPIIRWCTKHLKTRVMDLYFKELAQEHEITRCVGIAADETERLEREWNKDHRHPLVEWGWTEQDCLNYCYSRGLDWGGLYETFNRVSCWCCPLAPISELRKLWKYYPELWQQLEQWDKIVREREGWENMPKFKNENTVERLTKRFEREDRLAKMQTKLEAWQ